ncbi:uncharacterized protein [Rutidosis leptorrhynchoides]|uniref:uncharacterized protein isoform X2 n=1 Tax=Rutidosis leptorrhynchoides TaxID=125765 RepID=UPI003A9A0534
MAEQCNENAIATHTSTAKWWPDVHASSICSWTTGANYATNPPNPSSNCSGGEEDVSMSNSFTTNASNNSGLSMESSRRLVEKASVNDPYGEAVSDNHHLWNQVLLSETTGELQHISTRMYEPACDYLKKIDSSSAWEFSSPTNPEISPQFNPQYNAQFAPIKNEHVESDIEHEGLFRRGLNTNDIGYQGGVSDMVSADNNKYCNNYNGTADIECANGMGFVDLVAFGSYLNKAPSESQMSYKSIMNAINLPDRRDPVMHNSYQPVKLRGGTLNNKVNGRGNGVANEGKRKKSEDQSGSTLKKTKLDHTSTVSSTNKIQVPKAKLGDKITVLQQIVSPFGKIQLLCYGKPSVILGVSRSKCSC